VRDVEAAVIAIEGEERWIDEPGDELHARPRVRFRIDGVDAKPLASRVALAAGSAADVGAMVHDLSPHRLHGS
jgi:hypothetical protein